MELGSWFFLFLGHSFIENSHTITYYPFKVYDSFFFCIFEELCNHQYNFRTFPTAWKSSRYPLAVVLPQALPLPARGEADPLSVPWGLLILDICWFHINGIIPHVGWPVWLLSLGVVFSRLVVLQPVLTLHSFLSWVACAIVWWRHVFVHPFFGQWTVGLFPFWFSWTVILWTSVYKFCVFISLGHIPRSGIAGLLCANSMLSPLRNCHVFHSECLLLFSTSRVWGFQVSHPR